MAIKILVVDENLKNRQFFRKNLQEINIDVDITEVDTGVEAIELSSRNVFDCVFIDTALPDQESTDVYREISNSSIYIPAFVFLTDHRGQEEALRREGLEGTDILDRKELSPVLLENMVNFALSKKSLLQQVKSLTNVDILTNLNNRMAFLEGLKNAIAHSDRTDRPFAVVLLDIDHFKDINEGLGHDLGDLLLKEMAQRLKQHTRATDFLSRLSADEFGIIATNLWDNDCAATFCKRMIEISKVPFYIEKHKIYISLSIGVSMYPSDAKSAEALLINGQTALNRAKSVGRDMYCFYDEKANELAKKRIEIEHDLRAAIGTDQFVLFYQPKIDVTNTNVVGMEALIRWFHPTKGMIPPLDFIGIAEKNHMIVEIGTKILEDACRQVMKWSDEGLPILPVSVNLSAQQMDDVDFVPKVLDILKRTGMPAQYLELEITESMLMKQVERVSEYLKKLREIGVKVSIDDFGTGYSSLAYLKKLPIDTLKIDKTFIEDINADADANIAQAIISLGKIVNLTVVAEGVETQDQLEFLKKNGCDQAQGFYFSRPLPPDEFVKWYKQFTKGKG